MPQHEARPPRHGPTRSHGSGTVTGTHAAPRHRQAARRDRGALRRPLAGAAVLRHAPRLPARTSTATTPTSRTQLTVVVELPGRRPGEHRASSSASARSWSAASGRGRRSTGASTSRWRSSTARSSARCACPRTSTRSARRPTFERGIVTVTLPVTDAAPATPRPRHDRGAAAMSDVTFEMPDRRSRTTSSCRPSLPVLPLKETVVFPQSMTPLAIGQERSVRLIDDVVAGDRAARARDRDATRRSRRPSWDDIYEVGTVAIVHKMIKVPDGTLRILVGGLQRVRIAERDLRRPVPRRPSSRPCPTSCDEHARGRGADAQRPGPVRAHHRPRAVPARGAAARRRERRRPERARAPRRLDDAHDPDRGAPADPRDGRRRAAPAPDLRRS